MIVKNESRRVENGIVEEVSREKGEGRRECVMNYR
jgi:hypothetical protein